MFSISFWLLAVSEYYSVSEPEYCSSSCVYKKRPYIITLCKRSKRKKRSKRCKRSKRTKAIEQEKIGRKKTVCCSDSTKKIIVFLRSFSRILLCSRVFASVFVFSLGQQPFAYSFFFNLFLFNLYWQKVGHLSTVKVYSGVVMQTFCSKLSN